MIPKRKTNRFILNHDTAEKVVKEFFPDCFIYGFDPDWALKTPQCIPTHPATFAVPDFIMGLLAEKIGLIWAWDKHPSQLKKEYEDSKQRLQELKDLSRDWIREYGIPTSK